MQAAPDMPSQRRLALTIVVMAATLIQILDSTIANVALPHMQAALGATPDTISWVLTSYIVASAVATPMTGWLEARISRRMLMALAVGGFTIASVFCGLAISIQMMVGARLVQGVFGAFIGPLGQAVMLDIYPEKDRPRAMSIWAMGVMIGPIVGPVVGGILTDTYNWRWVFFINVPVGIFVLVGIFALMPRDRLPRIPFDAVGFAMLALGLAAMQLVLDRGTQLDWLSSTEIMIEIAVAVSMLWMFIVHTITSPNPLIPVELFRDRNFLIANLFFMFVMGIFTSAAAILPPMLQSLFGYNATHAGLLVMPRGIAIMFSMFVLGRIAGKVDSRILVGIGMVLVGSAQWAMTGFSLKMDEWPVIITGLVQGVGTGFIMVPLNLLAFSTISAQVRTNGAAVWSLSRNIGGSITISMFTALSAYNLQVNHSSLSGEIASARFPFLQGGLIERLGMSGGDALRLVDQEVNRQAMMISYLDNFWLMSVIIFTLLPLTLLLRPRKDRSGSSEPMVIE